MKKKESTKETILATASRLFQRQGYHGTGLNQIIEESGAPKGSIYYHFPNGKEEIAIEAINLMKNHVLENAVKDLSISENPVEAFQHHINNVAMYFDHEGCTDGLQMGTIASEISTTHELLRHTCESAYKEWQALYSHQLEQFGFDRERAEELSVAINAMMEGACILSMTTKSAKPFYSIAKQLPLLLGK